MSRTFRLRSISGSIAACLLSMVALGADVAKARFDLSAQPLGKALNAFAIQAGVNIYFDPPAVVGLEAPALKAELTTDEALEQLLEGTGLRAVYVNESTIRVVAPSAATAVSAGKGTLHLTGENQQGALRVSQSDNPSPAAGEGAPKGADEDKKSSISEIIVTATKRTERLQDVPASIGVVTADDIDRRGLVGSADYLRGIPGASQTENIPSQSLVIRGLEANTSFQGTRGGETTGTYFGETPTTGFAGSTGSNVDIKVVDIERVEVLRGPQGTAFGSSSLGGTVRILPAAPKLNEFEGRLGTGYSVTSGTGDANYTFQGVANIPLITDRLAIRGVAYTFSDSGYYRNRAGSDAAFQAAHVVPFGAQAFATDEEEVGAYYATGARLSALFQANENLRFTFSYLKQENETDGIPVATSASFDQLVLRVAPEHVRRGQTLGVNDASIDIANAVVEYDLGWADLLGTYSLADSNTVYMRPYYSIGFRWAGSNAEENRRRQHSGEVRLASKFDGPLNFLGGIYAEKVTGSGHTGIVWFGDPATNIFAPNGPRVVIDTSGRGRDLKQKAAFGEVSWKFLPGVTLTGGFRVFETYRGVSHAPQGSGPAFDPNAVPPPEFEDTDSVFRANLSYKPSDNILLYGGWSQGFRPGTSTTGLNPLLCDVNPSDGTVDGTNITLASTREVHADKVNNYELGIKLAAFDSRLNIDSAIFRMDWTDVPVTNLVTSSTSSCRQGYRTNAGDARSEGVELQANFQATDSLRLDLGGSYIRAEIIKGSTDFPTGKRLPGAPKVNANLGLQQSFTVGGHEAYVRADAIYLGSFFGEIQNLPITKTDAYVKLDATARVTVNNLNVDLYVRNLTDEDAYVSRGVYNVATAGLFNEFYGYRLRPRTVGIQLGYEF